MDHSSLATEEVLGQVLSVHYPSFTLLLVQTLSRDSYIRIPLLDLDGLVIFNVQTLRVLSSLRTSLVFSLMMNII